jgi:hypothetical protein
MDKVKAEGRDAAMKVDKDSGIDAKKRGSFNFGKLQASRTLAATKFEGKCNESKGNLYDCSDMKQADLFCEDDEGDRRLCRAHLQIQW